MLAAACCWPTYAKAQFGRQDLEPQPGNSCTAHLGGAAVIPSGKDGANFNKGWGITGGGGFQVTHSQEPGRAVPVLFLGLEYLFVQSTGNPVPSTAPVTPSTTRGDFSALSFEPQLRFHPNHKTMVYSSVGFGWLRRSAEQQTVTPPTIFQLGDTTTNKLVTNSGSLTGSIGMQVKVAGNLAVYVEGRAVKGMAISHNLILVPISMGLRW